MSHKTLASALVITPVILLASCGSNEQSANQKSATPTPESNSLETQSSKNTGVDIESVTTENTTGTTATWAVSQSSDTPTNEGRIIVAGNSITKEVHYSSPAGIEDIEFTLTTSGETITAVAAKPLANHPISKKLQTKFSEEIAKEVVWKKKSELQIDAVGGASLTTNAFKQFVAQN